MSDNSPGERIISGIWEAMEALNSCAYPDCKCRRQDGRVECAHGGTLHIGKRPPHPSP